MEVKDKIYDELNEFVWNTFFTDGIDDEETDEEYVYTSKTYNISCHLNEANLSYLKNNAVKIFETHSHNDLTIERDNDYLKIELEDGNFSIAFIVDFDSWENNLEITVLHTEGK